MCTAQLEHGTKISVGPIFKGKNHRMPGGKLDTDQRSDVSAAMNVSQLAFPGFGDCGETQKMFIVGQHKVIQK